MEVWRDIPGYEGIYQASNQGQIRSCEGKITSNARYAKRMWKQRILKQKVCVNKWGRRDARVSLWKDGVEKTFLVSRLVAFAWVEGYETGMTVNHKDGNTLNNATENLEWLSLPENIRRGFEDGLYKTQHAVTLISENGTAFRFGSQAKASAHIGRCKGYINQLIQRRKQEARGAKGEKYALIIGGEYGE